MDPTEQCWHRESEHSEWRNMRKRESIINRTIEAVGYTPKVDKFPEPIIPKWMERRAAYLAGAGRTESIPERRPPVIERQSIRPGVGFKSSVTRDDAFRRRG